MDREGLEAWLKARSHEEIVLFAQRAALRVLPIFVGRFADPTPKNIGARILPVFGTLISSGVLGARPSKGVRSAATQLSSSAANIARALAGQTISGYYLPSVAAASSAVRATRTTIRSDREGFASAVSACLDTLDAATTSVNTLTNKLDLAQSYFVSDVNFLMKNKTFRNSPIWNETVPAWFEDLESKMETLLEKEFAIGNFWHRWWLAAKSSKPLDWELQRDVALIPNEVWKAGPEAVMAAIAEIEARFALREELVALRQKLQEYESAAVLQASAAQRGHNQPPELIEPEVAVGQQISIMVKALIEAEEELAKPDPAPGLLTQVAEVLVQGAKRIALYCGSLADVALKKAAEEIGSTGVKWGFRVGGLTIASQMEPIRNVAKALVDFVRAYHGG